MKPNKSLSLIHKLLAIAGSLLSCEAFVVPKPHRASTAIRSPVVHPGSQCSTRRIGVLFDGVSGLELVEQTQTAMTYLAAAAVTTEPWVQPTVWVLDPFLNFMSLAFLSRVVLSWYPEAKLTELPWILLVFPTEPFLKIAKGSIPPAFGVDITPVFWLAITTFLHEILLGQQGLLTMKLKYGI
jgi:YggT family protein